MVIRYFNISIISSVSLPEIKWGTIWDFPSSNSITNICETCILITCNKKIFISLTDTRIYLYVQQEPSIATVYKDT